MAKLGKRTVAAREAFAGKDDVTVEEAVADESVEQAHDTQVEYEKSGNQLIWIIAFVVLVFAIISAL